MALVRRLLAWTAGVVGIAALGRALARTRRPHARPPRPPAVPVDERAEALRRKLSETRAAGEPPTAATTPEPDPHVTAAQQPSETIEERRARVHAKAQEVIDAMQEPLE
jgi:hypothetical protein